MIVNCFLMFEQIDVLEDLVDKPSIKNVENAFLPSKEIKDSHRFSGRKASIESAFYGLIADGGHIAIVGNRGIGKTSLARQVINIGTGDNELLDKLGLNIANDSDFLPIYLACDNNVSSIDELLERLLTTSDCLVDWIYDVPSAKRILTSLAPKVGANLFGAKVELGGSKDTELTTEPVVSSKTLPVIFSNIVNEIVKQGFARDGILIVVDEFDQIKNISGFASFLKAIATNTSKVKFCIVGVAKDIQELMREHESSDRLFSGNIITLDSMYYHELDSIIDNAEDCINGYIKFDDSARRRMIRLANGHPYLIHLIGKYSLREAFKNDKKIITESDVNSTLSDIAEKKADVILENKYRTAVGSSPQREIVLKSMAVVQDEQNEIFTTNAYKVALSNGVDNASQHVGLLVSSEHGAELEKIRERYYRFKDSLFHSYVLARPSLFNKSSDEKGQFKLFEE